jgi:putative Mg2+ transporter-C (MgtC) family protein
MPDELVSALQYGGPVLRLVLAAALGGAIGLERAASGKPAGFRTHLLICMGAALLADVSVLVARDVHLPGGFRADPGRIAAQVVSGIGFLGAGTIIRSRGSVTGLTTAATLWVVAAIGIAAGAGAYLHAIAGAVLVLVALRALRRFEYRVHPGRVRERVLRAVLDPRPEVITAAEQVITGSGLKVTGLDVEKGEGVFVAAFDIRSREAGTAHLLERLLQVDGVRRVSVD